MTDHEPDRGAGDPAALASRRKHGRTTFETRVECIEMDDDGVPRRPIPAQTHDISRAGVCLVTPTLVHLGRTLILFIPRKGAAPRMLVGVVRQSRYEAGKGYIAGVEFCDPPNNAAFRSWLRARSHGRQGAG